MHDRERRPARGDEEDQGVRSGNNSHGADAETFREIFDRYSRPVCGFLLGMLGDRAAAEEAMQETFIRAFRGMGAMRGGSVLSTWIFGIARNVAREELRSRRRRSRQVGLEQASLGTLRDSSGGPESAVCDAEALQAIRAALGELPEDQRLVFVLKVLRQMRYEEIAAITGSTVAKLKTDLHRARTALRNRLQPYFGTVGMESAR